MCALCPSRLVCETSPGLLGVFTVLRVLWSHVFVSQCAVAVINTPGVCLPDLRIFILHYCEASAFFTACEGAAMYRPFQCNDDIFFII